MPAQKMTFGLTGSQMISPKMKYQIQREAKRLGLGNNLQFVPKAGGMTINAHGNSDALMKLHQRMQKQYSANSSMRISRATYHSMPTATVSPTAKTTPAMASPQPTLMSPSSASPVNPSSVPSSVSTNQTSTSPSYGTTPGTPSFSPSVNKPTMPIATPGINQPATIDDLIKRQKPPSNQQINPAEPMAPSSPPPSEEPSPPPITNEPGLYQ